MNRISTFVRRALRKMNHALAASSEQAEALQRARYNVYR